jgi:hypothetical protein
VAEIVVVILPYDPEVVASPVHEPLLELQLEHDIVVRAK